MRKDLKDELRKYYGYPPYDGADNIVRADKYFLMSIEDRWSKEEIDKAREELKDERRVR